MKAALGLLDEVGLDGLTMRTLADRLRVQAGSLYWHLRDKNELAELLVEAINAEMGEPDSRQGWRAQLEWLAWEWRRVLLAHRDAARLVMAHFVARPVTLRRVELVTTLLRQAGFTGAEAANAAYLVATFVPGFVAAETIFAERGTPAPTSNAGALPDNAKLEIGWARRLAISATSGLAELYRASSAGRALDISSAGGVVAVPSTPGRKPSAIVLNSTVGWEISVHHEATQLTADLRGLLLRGVEVGGGANSVELTLPVPSATVPIQFAGGTSKLTIHRPPDVPVRLTVRGPFSRVALDGQPYRSASQLMAQSPGYDQVSARYDVTLLGGTSRVVVDALMPAGESAGPGSSDLSQLGEAMSQQSMPDRFGFAVQVLLDGLEQRAQP